MELIVDVDEETYTLLRDHLHLSPGLFLEFLTVFSRAEYALKAAQYHEQAPHVTPSWDRFANHINTDFRLITDTEFLEAVNYLMTNPPGKQVIEDGELRFRPTDVDPDQTRAQQVLGLVRRVRNNLCTAPGFLDTRLRYAAWRSSYCSRASSGVRYASFSRRQHWL